MEAKVDLQKLQILNERINQTIEALNQVRQTVRGISHTAAREPWSIGQPYFGSSAGPAQFMPQYSPFGGGLQHTSPFGVAMGNVQQPYGSYAGPVMGQLADPRFATGISHSSPELLERLALEARANDPFRLAQTFPNLNAPVQYGVAW